jgi:Flp pilus assembly pilin Flp
MDRRRDGIRLLLSIGVAVRPRREDGFGGIAAWSTKHRLESPQEQTTLPDYEKGGELVLKLFAFTQALVANATDALRRDEGQTMAEYGVVLAVITLAVIAAISLLSENVRNAIESVANIL